MAYHIAGIDVHKKMLAVAVEGDYHFERLKVGTIGEIFDPGSSVRPHKSANS